jgi:Asp-tRNA(Asn)/Glu-tRNA(Gln) amidotransferase A subunit family amidase
LDLLVQSCANRLNRWPGDAVAPCRQGESQSDRYYVAAEQGFERIRDAYAEFFTRFDAVLLPVLPIPAHKYDLSEFVIAGQTVDVTHIQTFTVQFNITGIESISPAAIFTPTPRR